MNSLIQNGRVALDPAPDGAVHGRGGIIASHMVGETIGHYRVTGSIGRGGMGEVFAATDTRLNRRVALKVLPPQFSSDSERLTRFEREARAASALNHPNIVTIYDVCVSGETPYIAMELVEGRSLRDLLNAGPMPAAQIIDFAAQLAAGLAKAHEAGIVHRDLKPENLIVSIDGFLKILDFGLAKLTVVSDPDTQTQTMTRVGSVMGTAAYMSPEQAAGRSIDFRSDLFSFGVIVYEMAAGRNPFLRDTTTGTLAAIIEREAEPLRFDGAALSAVVERCLQKDPERRYGSTRELEKDLSEHLETPHVQKKNIPALRWIAAAGILAMVGAGVLWIVLGKRAAAQEARRLVAVRNFRNLSGDAAQEYFASGVTQEIRDQMSRINGLRLLSAGAVGRYGDGQNRRLVAETGAGSIVEGAVRVADGRVRVDVELIDGGSEQTLWSDKFEQKMEDIFTVQSDIAASIAGALKTRFGGGEQTQSAKRPTANIEAYDLYLRSQRMRRNREFNEKAMEMLRRAIELDPYFAEAMAELSRRNLSRVYYADTSQTQQALDWANKAIAIVPGSHRAYLALGENYSILGRSESARAAFARCLELSPNSQECMNDIADLDMELGRFEEALQWSRKALLLSPNIGNPYYHVGTAVDLFGDPGVIEKWLSLHQKRFAGEGSRVVKGMAMLELGRVADALAEARMMVERAPQSDSGRAFLAEMAFLTRAPDAEALTEPFFSNGPDPRFTNWPLMPHSARSRYAYLLLKRGDRRRALTMLEEARKAIEAFLAEGIDSPLAFEELAAIHAMRGDKPSALREYRRAYNAGWRLVTLTSLNPMLDPLRSDPEFQQVVARMKSDVVRMRSESKELRELQEKTIPFLESLPLPGR